MDLLRHTYSVYKRHGAFVLLQRTIRYFIRFCKGTLKTTLSTVFPIKSGLILFGFTNQTKSNSGLTYKWFVENDVKGITPVWVTQDKHLYNQLADDGYPVVSQSSLFGQYLLLRADIACYDSLPTGVLPDSVTTISMNHKIPVKAGAGGEKWSNSYRDWQRHDYYLSTSDFISEKRVKLRKVESGPDMKLNQLVNTGYPQNDLLFNSQNNYELNEYIDDSHYDMVILYAPTRRPDDIDGLEIFPFDDFSVPRLVQLLEELNALLIIRLHPNDDTKIKSNSESYNSIHNFDSLWSLINVLDQYNNIIYDGHNTSTNINKILQFLDVLITDYSTIYHTYLLLDNPMIFFPYDYHKFEKRYGFKYDYFEYLPGPAIDNFNGFEEYLYKISSDRDPHKKKRQRLKNKIHNYDDGRSTERVADFIIELVRQNDAKSFT